MVTLLALLAIPILANQSWAADKATIKAWAQTSLSDFTVTRTSKVVILKEVSSGRVRFFKARIRNPLLNHLIEQQDPEQLRLTFNINEPEMRQRFYQSPHWPMAAIFHLTKPDRIISQVDGRWMHYGQGADGQVWQKEIGKNMSADTALSHSLGYDGIVIGAEKDLLLVLSLGPSLQDNAIGTVLDESHSHTFISNHKPLALLKLRQKRGAFGIFEVLVSYQKVQKMKTGSKVRLMHFKGQK